MLFTIQSCYLPLTTITLYYLLLTTINMAIYSTSLPWVASASPMPPKRSARKAEGRDECPAKLLVPGDPRRHPGDLRKTGLLLTCTLW